MEGPPRTTSPYAASLLVFCLCALPELTQVMPPGLPEDKSMARFLPSFLKCPLIGLDMSPVKGDRLVSSYGRRAGISFGPSRSAAAVFPASLCPGARPSPRGRGRGRDVGGRVLLVHENGSGPPGRRASLTLGLVTCRERTESRELRDHQASKAPR